MTKSNLFRTNFVYGKFSFKRITSHNFKPYHNARLLTVRNTAQPFLFSNLTSSQHFKSNETLLKTFSAPFCVDVEVAKYVENREFPAVRSHALFMKSLFGSTYVCEQLFFRMKNVKSKVRTRLTEVHLENSLQIASSHIKADIDKLVKQKQRQICHWIQTISDVHEFMFCKFSIMIFLRN
jgi:hypothetical protein